LIDALCAVRNGTDHRVPMPLQATAADFIGNGHLGAHIRRSKVLYTERRAALLSAINSEGGGWLTMPTASTGLHWSPSCLIVATIRRSRRPRGTADWRHSLVGIFCRCLQNATTRLLMGFGNTRSESMKGAIQTLCRLIE
jgi:GntR family transcriptional regulator/MocR family aminotransferase